ncbi:uncharacterized protein LOC131675361 [Phymastichus coffea]|uniref:uncharacterized protein LOC131675361 n=1 Tax=Phymastichus coffea TaxID=108790 RepID=UPI00273BABC3|nr:uncharacterized protein LOC131675361 [Phymastichus coffea]
MDLGPAGPLLLLLPALLLLLVGDTTSLQDLKMTVPARVRVGDSALLICSYDLQNNQLYAIKWYLDDGEFYSYTPKNNPPHKSFNHRSIKVNVSSSNMQDVTLVNVLRSHSGKYRCEVTEEAPNYDTRVQEAEILVVDVPKKEPTIAVDRQHLQEGERLRANCTSGASRPAPNITWTLNGAPLNRRTAQYKEEKRNLPNRADNESMSLTHSSLSLNTSGLFREGRIRLRCFAEITPVYNASASIAITEDVPNIASITGDASSHSRQSSGCNQMVSLCIWSHGLATLTMSLTLHIILDSLITR